MVALFTGMRLGEILALRWGRIDLDRNVIQVREAVEHTKAHGLRFKSPKSKAGRRDITMPDLLIETLRDYRKVQLELRMKLGAENCRTTHYCSPTWKAPCLRPTLCRRHGPTSRRP